jgi:hypothetical protein
MSSYLGISDRLASCVQPESQVCQTGTILKDTRMKLFAFEYDLMVLCYSTATHLSLESLGLSRIMVQAQYRVGSPWERSVVEIHPTKVYEVLEYDIFSSPLLICAKE